MKKVYIYDEQEFTSLYELRKAMPTVSLPVSPQDADLVALGVVIIEVAEETEDLTLEERKDIKAHNIRMTSERKIQAIQEGYTLGEVNTFEQQYTGAVEILKTGVASDVTKMSKDAQFVVGLARGRSEVGGVDISPEELSQKIVDNYNAAKEYTVAVLSIQQGLETRVRLASSREDLAAIQWPETV